MTGRHAEAVLLETSGQGLTDPTVLTEAVFLEEEGSVGAVGEDKPPTAATAMPAHMIKVPRKATWVVTIITSPARHLGSTIRTATTMHQVPGSTLTLLADTIRVMAMKVRLRVPFEFLSFSMA